MNRLVLTGSGRLHVDDIGVVHYVVRSNAKQFTARWKGAELQLTVPPRVSEKDFYDALAEMKPRLLQRKPDSGRYYSGMTVDAGEFRVVIEVIESNSGRLAARRITDGWAIYVPAGLNLADSGVQQTVSLLLRRIAMVEAPDILLPRAKVLAEAVRQRPTGWTISKGLRTLGRCDARGWIALSCILVYYPQELRDYVIYHELAHLSEMNHSPRFHQLCDSYCGGRERELIARLKAMRLPF